MSERLTKRFLGSNAPYAEFADQHKSPLHCLNILLEPTQTKVTPFLIIVWGAEVRALRVKTQVGTL